MSYKLSKLDVGGVALAVGAIAAHKAMTVGLGSFQLGEVVGALILYLLVCYVFASFIYRVTQQNEKAGSMAFLLLMALMVLVNFAMSRDLERKQAREQNEQHLGELQSYVEDYKNKKIDATDSEDLQKDYGEFTENMQSKIGQMADTATGDEKRVYEILNEFLSDTKVTVEAWQASFVEVQSDRVLDFSRLNSDEEFAYQLGAVKNYQEKTVEYREVFLGSVDRFKKMLEPVGDSGFAKGAIKGMERKHYKQRPIFIKLIDAHEAYGKSFEDLLVLLRDNRSQWNYNTTEQQMYFETDEMVEQFNQILERLVESENSINEYSPKLIDTL